MNLTSKTINELCTGENGQQFRFHIPTYQRGYRWEEHVDILLDDLFEYVEAKREGKNVGAYYCLQPIVVMRNEKLDDRGIGYEVIDGQQRLTTILILLKALNHSDDWYLVTYERDGREHEREIFLNEINKTPAASKKADFYYIKGAYDRAVSWVTKKKGEIGSNPKTKLLSALLDEVRLIWYELPQGSNAREEFRHINDGKIPLTSSELIKAMMLNQKHFKISSADENTQNTIVRNRQERIARMWDEIERTLQTTDFWAFIYSESVSLSTRIDYIFKLIYLKNNPSPAKTDPISIFEYFESRLSDADMVDVLWKEVRELFRIFQDWYSCISLYNYIGFLVQYNVQSLLAIIKQFGSCTKTEFETWLCDTIKNNVRIDEDGFGQLSYSTDTADRKKVEKLLMLFNIEVMNQMNKRFDFNTEGGWSIEHVFARNSIKIPEDKRQSWLSGYMRVINSAIKHVEDAERNANLHELKRRLAEYNGEGFEDLFNAIIDTVESTCVETDNISNLALIGLYDNSSLSNSAFYEKREKIIRLLEQGRNIPQGTVNVFMKFYSGVGTNLDYWSADDGEAYLRRLKSLLQRYFIDGGVA